MALTVGRLAQAAGVGVETIRFYEKRGLIVRPPPPPNGYRVYGDDDVARIHFIKSAQALGFTLKEIGELLQLEADSRARCSDVQERAHQKMQAVDDKIAELTRMRAELAKLASSCAPDQPLEECRLLNCMSGRC